MIVNDEKPTKCSTAVCLGLSESEIDGMIMWSVTAYHVERHKLANSVHHPPTSTIIKKRTCNFLF